MSFTFTFPSGLTWDTSVHPNASNFAGRIAGGTPQWGESTDGVVIDSPTDFSLEMWVITPASQVNQLISYKRMGGGNPLLFQTGNPTDDVFIYQFGASQLLGTIPTPGSYFHVVGTFDNTTSEAKLYIDGALQDTRTINPSIDFAVGQWDLGDQFGFNVGDITIDEIRLYSRVLDATEVNDHFNDTFSDDTLLELHIRFSEGSGSTATSNVIPSNPFSWSTTLLRPGASFTEASASPMFLSSDLLVISALMQSESSPIRIDALLFPPPPSAGQFRVATGNAATIQATLPTPQFYADFDIMWVAELLRPLAEFLLDNATIIRIDSQLHSPRVKLDVLNSPTTGAGAPGLIARLLVPRASFSLLSENFIRLEGMLSPPRSRFTMASGGVMQLIATLPFDGTVDGFCMHVSAANIISLLADLPRPQLEMTLKSVIAEMWRCWVMNARHKDHPLTEYDNFHFNSMALFDGKIFAAGPDGLFVLGLEGDDDGTKIPAKIKTGEEDYDQSMMIRVPRIYVGGSSERGMEFRTIVTDNGTRVYRLPQSSNDAIQQRRVPVGRGPKSRYWQFEVRNIDGGDMSLESIIIYPEQTTRRVK